MTTLANEDKQYDAESIQVLKGLEAVRVRPGMYIGSTSTDGLHHLIKEILDNSVDEALAGHCDLITVNIDARGAVTVTDNGRGIPVDQHPDTGLSALETILTTLHAGGKFDNEAYKVSGGLHGVGASVVNALASELTATVWRDAKTWSQSYVEGIPTQPIQDGGRTNKRGTSIRWTADPKIFPDRTYEFLRIAQLLRTTAYLNPGLTLRLVSAYHEKERQGDIERTYCYDSGISSMVQSMTRRTQTALPEPFYFETTLDECDAAVAFQYRNDDLNCVERSYANCIETPEGGNHLTGFRAALTRTINDYAAKNPQLKTKGASKEAFKAEDVRSGLMAVVSVKLGDPQFEGQTKNKLTNTEIRGALERITSQKLAAWLESNPAGAKAVIACASTGQAAREAATRAKDLVTRKNALDGSALPGKLADCSEQSPHRSELYIVEGESAGGSAKMGRDRNFQAILPLKGKILNVERFTERVERILSNEEIRALISAVGTQDGPDFNIDKLRYHKIIIMTDADVDGSHIRTLILTYFYRRMPELIRHGHLFIAQPPLYQVKRGQNVAYAWNDDQKDELMERMSTARSAATIQRYKGLGEMNDEQLWETTMNPDNRRMMRVRYDDIVEAGQTIRMLMGEEVAPRKSYIMSHAHEAVLDV